MENLDKVIKVMPKTVKYLDLSDRDILKNNIDFENIFKEFLTLKEVNLNDNDLTTLEESNRFFTLLKSIKNLECI